MKSMVSIPETVMNQLTPQEREDIFAGIRMVSMSGDDECVQAFVWISLLALGFDNDKRAN